MPPADGRAPGTAARRLFVGRVGAEDRALEVAWLDFRGEGEARTVEVNRFRVYTTTLDGSHYASVGEDEAGWIVLLYDLTTPDVLELRGLDETCVAAAVEAGELAGRVDRSDGIRVTVRATPAQVAAWIRSHVPGCFGAREPGHLRRLVLPE